MWISKKRFLQMEANINRLVYVQQQQHKALESMGVLLNTAADTLKTPFRILPQAEMKPKNREKRGNERGNTEKLRK